MGLASGPAEPLGAKKASSLANLAVAPVPAAPPVVKGARGSALSAAVAEQGKDKPLQQGALGKAKQDQETLAEVSLYVRCPQSYPSIFTACVTDSEPEQEKEEVNSQP